MGTRIEKNPYSLSKKRSTLAVLRTAPPYMGEDEWFRIHLLA